MTVLPLPSSKPRPLHKRVQKVKAKVAVNFIGKSLNEKLTKVGYVTPSKIYILRNRRELIDFLCTLFSFTHGYTQGTRGIILL